ncbi:MAG: DUF4405 domain-containing protein [Chloroflexi bacterium]|nr:DUF4405 domain-containing protein [Chloroflexota bacterium]
MSWLGLLLLPLIVIDALTGLVLWIFFDLRLRLPDDAARAVLAVLSALRLPHFLDQPVQADIHIWVGLVSIPLLVVKSWATWPMLRHWRPPRTDDLDRALDRALAWAMPVLFAAIFVSGLLVYVRWTPGGRDFWLESHLWLSFLAVVPILYHLWRYLPLALRVVAWAARRPTANRVPR